MSKDVYISTEAEKMVNKTFENIKDTDLINNIHKLPAIIQLTIADIINNINDKNVLNDIASASLDDPLSASNLGRKMVDYINKITNNSLPSQIYSDLDFLNIVRAVKNYRPSDIDTIRETQREEIMKDPSILDPYKDEYNKISREEAIRKLREAENAKYESEWDQFKLAFNMITDIKNWGNRDSENPSLTKDFEIIDGGGLENDWNLLKDGAKDIIATAGDFSLDALATMLGISKQTLIIILVGGGGIWLLSTLKGIIR